MFQTVLIVFGLYVCWRAVWPQRWPRAVKWVIGVGVLLASQFLALSQFFFGSVASPELPRPLLILACGAFASVLLGAGLLLITDSALLVASVFKRDRAAFKQTALKLRTGVCVLAVLLSAVGLWEAIRVPPVKQVTLAVQGLPVQLDGLRVLHLTDTHASRLLQRPWIQAVVEKANATHPDLLLFTGDLVDGSVSARMRDVEPYAQLRATLGVYAIPGNHEYYSNYKPWLARFNALGLKMLLNDHVTLQHNGARFHVAGITDQAAARYGDPMPDIHAALAGVPRSDTVLLMSHRPTGAQRHAAAGADVQLSGHTHGGQVAGIHWLAARANEGFVSGEYAVGPMKLYVSNGAGLWPGFPIRLGRRSEITLITLTKAP